jgi:hypothetical protein
MGTFWLRQVSWRLVVVAMTVGIPAGPARAWNKPGHMVTGAIAYAELKNRHPKVVARVVALLKQHPHYEEKWLPTLRFLSAADQDAYLFMVAARWPDDVRDDPHYHPSSHKLWHVVGLPFKPPGQPAHVKTRKPPRNNIFGAFDRNRQRVRSRAADKDRAVALCWVFHLVGDVHQPLHTVSLYTTNFPTGDAWATRFYVRSRAGTEPYTLHALWDLMPHRSDKVRDVTAKANQLRARYPRRSLHELKQVQFRKWADESHQLARKVAYRNGKLKGSRDERNGVPLPADYRAKAEPVAQRRMALAGYRLADLLQKWLR